MKITFNTVRELGLALPRTEECRYYRMPALNVDGEVFVVQTGHRSAEPNSVRVPVGFKERERLIAADPRVFYLKPHYEPYPVVLVRLDCIDRYAFAAAASFRLRCCVQRRGEAGTAERAQRRN
jgi:hypothetical protein